VSTRPAAKTPSTTKREQEREPSTFAAIDLGSNSFHMVIARQVHGELRIVDRLRDRVQLARGLDAKNRLSDEAQQRALAALEQFGQRVRGLSESHVRAVGTNTLRQGRNARSFLKRASRALGHPIEVISGPEEARLVYLGVAHTHGEGEKDAVRRLVVDIGGGSTECIVGRGFEPILRDSLYMGCVSFTTRFFPDGRLTAARMRAAQTAAFQEVASIVSKYRVSGWDEAVGSSGTINAIQEILRRNDWSDHGITRPGLKRLKRAIVSSGSIAELNVTGLSGARATVIAGGVAILRALFKSLDIERMHASTGALREGVLYDLVGRVQRVDIRERTIERFVEHYHVDRTQAGRVELTALQIYDSIAAQWGIDDPALRRMLSWAARLHEAGLVVSYRGYHKHGAYLAENSDMPGFSTDGQALLASLIRNHRRKLVPLTEELAWVTPEMAIRLCVPLRLATLLNRSRGGTPPIFSTRIDAGRLIIEFPEGWLASHPLTAADLASEADLLSKADFMLAVS